MQRRVSECGIVVASAANHGATTGHHDTAFSCTSIDCAPSMLFCFQNVGNAMKLKQLCWVILHRMNGSVHQFISLPFMNNLWRDFICATLASAIRNSYSKPTDYPEANSLIWSATLVGMGRACKYEAKRAIGVVLWIFVFWIYINILIMPAWMFETFNFFLSHTYVRKFGFSFHPYRRRSSLT